MGDFIGCFGAHVLVYAPLRCSDITPIRLTRTAFPICRFVLWGERSFQFYGVFFSRTLAVWSIDG
jgi:hypothetical protein